MNTQELLEVLACPRCLGKLEVLPNMEAPQGFACSKCDCVYPIREEIPVMLISEAIDRTSWNAGVREKGKH